MISAERFPPGEPLPPLEEGSDEDASDDESCREEEFDAIESYRQAYLQHHFYALGEEVVVGLILEREAHTLPPSRGARSPRRGSDEASAGAGSLSSESIESREKGASSKKRSGKKNNRKKNREKRK